MLVFHELEAHKIIPPPRHCDFAIEGLSMAIETFLVKELVT